MPEPHKDLTGLMGDRAVILNMGSEAGRQECLPHLPTRSPRVGRNPPQLSHVLGIVYLPPSLAPSPIRNEKSLTSSSNQRRYCPSARATKAGPRYT